MSQPNPQEVDGAGHSEGGEAGYRAVGPGQHFGFNPQRDCHPPEDRLVCLKLCLLYGEDRQEGSEGRWGPRGRVQGMGDSERWSYWQRI